MPQRLKSLQPQKIVIIRRNGIGDLLLAYPMLKRCRELYPTAYLIVVIDKRSKECSFWIENPPWDELRILNSGNKYLASWTMAWSLRRRKIDLAFSAKPTPMNLMNFFLAVVNATCKRAVINKNKLSHFYRLKNFWSYLSSLFINAPIDSKTLTVYDHQALKGLMMLEEDLTVDALGLKKKDQPRLPLAGIDSRLFPILKKVSVNEQAAFQNFCLKHSFCNHPEAITFYINFTNNRPASRLNSEMICEILQGLDFSFNIVLGGLLQDELIAKKWLLFLKNKLKCSIGIYLGSTLEKTLAAIQNVDLVITGDGGLMHLTAASKIHQIALFAHTSVCRWHPLSDQAICLSANHTLNELSIVLIREHIKRITAMILNKKLFKI